MKAKPVYKTWIRTNKIIIFLAISICLIIIALCPVNIYLRVLSGFSALPFLYITFIVSCTYYQFAPFGKDLQSKIHDLIIDKLNCNETGKLLDIGAGSASLIIKAAKAFPEASLVGIDYWGDNWEYSKSLCEMNAEIEAVSDRIEFVKASASKLPFSDNEFDALISCLTFHEVKDEQDKVKVLKEAFRVLKPGGAFVFMDLFMNSKIYGDYKSFQHEIKKLGISEFAAVKLDALVKLPRILQNKKSLGNAVLLIGRK